MTFEERLEQFHTWLKQREESTMRDFRRKGWMVKAEVTVIKEKFEAIFDLKENP